jgi:hypothetical protein
MIVGSGAKMLDGYPREAKADPTRPYVMWPGTQYEHLMLPVRRSRDLAVPASAWVFASGSD